MAVIMEHTLDLEHCFMSNIEKFIYQFFNDLQITEFNVNNSIGNTLTTAPTTAITAPVEMLIIAPATAITAPGDTQTIAPATVITELSNRLTH